MSEDETLRQALERHQLEQAVVGAEEGTITITLPWGRRAAYAVTIVLREHPDEFECVSFRVTSLRPGTSVGTAMLRGLPIATYVRRAIQCVLDERLAVAEQEAAYVSSTVVHTHVAADGSVSVTNEAADEQFRQASAEFWGGRRDQAATRVARVKGEGKGRRYPPGHLEHVAVIVRAAKKRGDPVQEAVMTEFGIKRSAAANQIARARAQGLLDSEEN